MSSGAVGAPEARSVGASSPETSRRGPIPYADTLESSVSGPSRSTSTVPSKAKAPSSDRWAASPTTEYPVQSAVAPPGGSPTPVGAAASESAELAGPRGVPCGHRAAPDGHHGSDEQGAPRHPSAPAASDAKSSRSCCSVGSVTAPPGRCRRRRWPGDRVRVHQHPPHVGRRVLRRRDPAPVPVGVGQRRLGQVLGEVPVRGQHERQPQQGPSLRGDELLEPHTRLPSVVSTPSDASSTA